MPRKLCELRAVFESIQCACVRRPDDSLARGRAPAGWPPRGAAMTAGVLNPLVVFSNFGEFLQPRVYVVEHRPHFVLGNGAFAHNDEGWLIR